VFRATVANDQMYRGPAEHFLKSVERNIRKNHFIKSGNREEVSTTPVVDKNIRRPV
jgi:hypothetical protein